MAPQSFYVLPRFQRAGTGTELFRRFVEWAMERGARSACVGIAPENPFRAFYLKAGGRYLNPHWICWDDIAALSRRLEPPPAREDAT